MNFYDLFGLMGLPEYDTMGLFDIFLFPFEIKSECCNVDGKYELFDPEMECCTEKGVFSRLDNEEMMVCIRVAQVPAGELIAKFEGFHMWIKSSTFGEIGLGPLQGGVPGYRFLPQDTPFDETSVNVHLGESEETDSECFPVSVNKCCIAEVYKNLGPTGTSCFSKNCNVWTRETIEKCGGDMDKVWDQIHKWHRKKYKEFYNLLEAYKNPNLYLIP